MGDLSNDEPPLSIIVQQRQFEVQVDHAVFGAREAEDLLITEDSSFSHHARDGFPVILGYYCRSLLYAPSSGTVCWDTPTEGTRLGGVLLSHAKGKKGSHVEHRTREH
jgi:hypothetical protein